MHFIFIVDYSKHTGSGHLKRTSYLAEYIENSNNEITFFIIGNFLKAKKQNQFTTTKFNLNKILKFNKNRTLIIIDSYTINKKIENKLFKNDYKVVFFDDKIKSVCKANILINQNLSFTNKDYKKINTKKLLIGEKFSIISDNLKSIKKNRKQKKKIKSIMFDFGQSSFKEMGYFLNHVKLIEGINYYVVLKKNWVNFDKLKNALKKKNVKIVHSDNLYFKTLNHIDLVIGGYGFSEIERKYLKIPSLAFSLSKDQKIIGNKNLKKQNNYLGDLNKKNIKRLNLLTKKYILDYKFFFGDLVKKMIKVDSKGKIRIFREIQKLI